ncbi:hypothetical protein E2C01_068460 [Portunus trituberculatus]|uniref:Uncharacterized protein n=1 Tax=Portunus trituberculatus TaxID=210409 RepID=A0A5B7HS13_PORTR|nr:hypothetical protein [Portunus trituberculatus]
MIKSTTAPSLLAIPSIPCITPHLCRGPAPSTDHSSVPREYVVDPSSTSLSHTRSFNRSDPLSLTCAASRRRKSPIHQCTSSCASIIISDGGDDDYDDDDDDDDDDDGFLY